MRISDGSSDVCSYDLDSHVPDTLAPAGNERERALLARRGRGPAAVSPLPSLPLLAAPTDTKLFPLPVAERRAGSEQRPRDGRLVHCQHAYRSEEHTSELQSLMRISYSVFCLKKKKKTQPHKSS